MKEKCRQAMFEGTMTNCCHDNKIHGRDPQGKNVVNNEDM